MGTSSVDVRGQGGGRSVDVIYGAAVAGAGVDSRARQRAARPGFETKVDFLSADDLGDILASVSHLPSSALVWQVYTLGSSGSRTAVLMLSSLKKLFAWAR